MEPPDALDQLVKAVQAKPRYQSIDIRLIQRIGAAELQKRRNLKDAIKETRAKLHQVAGAYQEEGIPYRSWQPGLVDLPQNLADPQVRAFCRQAMTHHTSTNERLPILETFFRETLRCIAPITSVLDLACGLNPLSIPWIPLSGSAQYLGCDIYADLVSFLNDFFAHFQINGAANLQDLLADDIHLPHTQVALLLKTIPCLEQIDKEAGRKLLERIPAEHLLVSFPVHSLGGRAKGMLANYERRFWQLIDGRRWRVERFEFPTELAFLVTK